MRPEKTAIVNEIRSQVAGSSFLLLTEYKGMKVSQTKELRKRLAKKKSEFHVVRNSFLKKAVADLPGIKMDEEINVPLAIVFGKGDSIDTAKVLHDFKREFNVGVINCGFWGGRRYSASDFEQILKLPPKSVLLGMLVGGLAAPMIGLAGVMRQKLAGLVYVLQAVQELKNKSSSKN